MPKAAFKALTVQANGIASRILTDIAVMLPFDPANPPNPPLVTVPAKALWDTGATNSVISKAIVQRLALKPVGVTQVQHAGGASQSPRYIVNLLLPDQVVVTGVLVTELQGTQPPDFDVIVGMDVITVGDFSITNVGGKTCMSYRIPSMGRIDYVEAWRKLQYAGVSRNDSCPCGARANGKPVKFKHCHGKRV